MGKNNLNPNFIRWVINMAMLAFVLGAVFLVIMAALTGCSTPKKTARKDKAALERVTAKRALIDSVAPIVFDLYPCANDTVTTFLSGGVDSVPYPIPVLDEARRALIIDSLNNVYADLSLDVANEAYDLGFGAAMDAVKNQKVPVKRPDTLQHSIVDRQKHNQYEKTIAALEKKVAALEAMNQQLAVQITEEKKEGKTFLWYFIAAVAACVLSNGLWVFAKIKNPLK
jgi:hypothetical protein